MSALQSEVSQRQHAIASSMSYNVPVSDNPQACCSVPPAVAKDYKEKGKYVEYAGMKTCPSPSHHSVLKIDLMANPT